MENKELLEKFKSIVEGTDVKEIYGYYNGESDEEGVDDWDYDEHDSIKGAISYNAPNEKNPNGVLTLSQSVMDWTQLPDKHIY